MERYSDPVSCECSSLLFHRSPEMALTTDPNRNTSNTAVILAESTIVATVNYHTHS